MRVVLQSRGLKLLQTLSARLGLSEGAARESVPETQSLFPIAELDQAVSTTVPAERAFAAAASATGKGEPHTEALAQLLEVVGRNPASPTVRNIREDLRGLLDVLRQEEDGHPPTETIPDPTASRTLLAGKKITLLGLCPEEQAAALDLLERQLATCRVFGFDPEVAPAGEALRCDLILLAAPPAWELTEPIDALFLRRYEGPVLVTGGRRVLTRVSQVEQPGPRDYLCFPWDEQDLLWRAAMLVSRPPVTRRPAEERPRREKAEILIADEDPTTRTLIASMLSRHGMICHTAENGAEALDLFKARRPCAVIADVLMPALDGFQLLAAVKQDPSLAHIPVLLLTARNAEVDKLQAFALGADDYITKPFSPMELAVRLKRLLKRPA